MTEGPIRTVDGRSDSGCVISVSLSHRTITISDGDLTDQTTNHLRLDVENAGKLGKVLVGLAAALETDSTRDGHGKHSTGRSDDERAVLRATESAAERSSGSSEWSSDQLAMIDTLVSGGANREDFTASAPERYMQFCEALRKLQDHQVLYGGWQELSERITETQCDACGRTFTYERKGRPPLTCSAECRRKRNNKVQMRQAN